MRWERQEGKEMVQDRLGERAVCDSVVCVCKFVYVKVLRVKELYVTKLCKSLCVKEMYVTKLCVKELCVTKLCVKELCVWQSCVWKACVPKLCVKWICDKVVKGSMYHQSQSSAISATPATQSGGRCREVPRLRRKVTVDVAKCHACVKQRRHQTGTKRHQSQPSAISATPATQMTIYVAKCHTCHAKWRSMSRSATPATQSDGRCRQVPRLPLKEPPKRATRASPVP